MQHHGPGDLDKVHAREHCAVRPRARGLGAAAGGDRRRAARMRQRDVEPVQRSQQRVQRAHHGDDQR